MISPVAAILIVNGPDPHTGLTKLPWPVPALTCTDSARVPVGTRASPA